MSMGGDDMVYPAVMDVSLTFGEWLEDLLEARHKTQADVAAFIGITQSAVSGWVTNDTRPTRRNARLLADFLGEDRSKVLALAGYDPKPLRVLVSRDGSSMSTATHEDIANVAEDAELYDPEDPIQSAALANQNKLTPRKRRMAARFIEFLAEQEDIDL